MVKAKTMLGVFYNSKKELKGEIGNQLEYVETSLFGSEYKSNGTLVVVGPDPFKKRKYFASVEMKNNLIVKVK